MSYTIGGECKSCGKPIWSKTNWEGAGDPPIKMSCSCEPPTAEKAQTGNDLTQQTTDPKPVTISGDAHPVKSGEINASGDDEPNELDI